MSNGSARMKVASSSKLPHCLSTSSLVITPCKYIFSCNLQHATSKQPVECSRREGPGVGCRQAFEVNTKEGKVLQSKEDRLTPISRLDFCAFDVETTGLSSFSRILEIGAVRFRRDGPPDFFNTLIKTGTPIHPGAAAIHGINESMLAAAPRARRRPSFIPGVFTRLHPNRPQCPLRCVRALTRARHSRPARSRPCRVRQPRPGA